MKRTVTIQKHAHLLGPGDRLLGKGGGRARVVVAVELSRGQTVARFAKGRPRVFGPLDRVRVKV